MASPNNRPAVPCYGRCCGYQRVHNTTSRCSVVGVMTSLNNRHCSSLAARAVSRAFHRNTTTVNGADSFLTNSKFSYEQFVITQAIR
ncbi:hypothetical protein NDU88_003935 [Pleurodeles waltl]|uniref:Uncharacterized protein n=1 Tax=Pleurodeles waltl TaxID=8319 RepID=A0AAV7UZZ1_PLEWA|nr:hypothetical protein NDU88_003935 [Pleurodeles waltl]